jgi:hypothetical protein
MRTTQAPKLRERPSQIKNRFLAAFLPGGILISGELLMRLVHLAVSSMLAAQTRPIRQFLWPRVDVF